MPCRFGRTAGDDGRGQIAPYGFSNSVEVRVMEDDFGSDDTVLYVNVTADKAGQGVQTATSWKWTGTVYVKNYELQYEVS